MKFSTYKNSKNIEHVIDLSTLKTYHLPHNKRINLIRDNRSFLNSEGYWSVFPLGFSESQVYIVCPYCGEIHSHGRGEKPAYHYEGHRVSHCVDNNGYVIMRQN